MSAAAVQPLSLSQARGTAFRTRYWIPALQLIVDILTLEAALIFAMALRVALSPWFSIHLSPAQVIGIAWGLLGVPLGYLLVGLYPGYGLAPVERLRRRVRANFFVFSGIVTWGYLVQRQRWSRGVLIAAFLLVLVFSPLVERLLIQILSRRGWWGTSVIVFGTNDSGRNIAELMRNQPALGFVPVAVLDIENDTPWTAPSLIAAANLHLRLAELDPAPVAVVAMPALDESRRLALLEALPFRRVIVISDVAQIQTQSVTTVEIGGALGLALNRNLLIPWNRWLKRALDLIAGSLLLGVTAPLIAFCAVWIRLTSAGPAFYCQQRTGASNHTIQVWKLRTMKPDADSLLQQCLEQDSDLRREWEIHFKLRRDPRVLPGVGKFLRRTSLDELPQLWNVVKGEMSLVGPRPFPQYHLDCFAPDFLRLRACVRPGITGLWQVSVRGEGDLTAQQALDTYYVRNWSLWLDIEIAIRTIRAVIRGSGAY